MCGLVFGISFLSRLESFTIVAIRVADADGVVYEEAARTLDQALTRNLLWIFSRRTVFFYPKGAMAAMLRSQNPRIDTVTFEVTADHTLLAHLSLRKPYATWCGGERSAEPACYFLDEKGYIFAPASYFSGTVFVKYYRALPEDMIIGSQMFDEKKFRLLTEFVGSLRSLGLTPEEVVLASERNEIYLQDGSTIIFNDEWPYEKVFANLASALTASVFKKNDTASSATKAQPRLFEYVDLRFENRVFYKPSPPS